MARSSCDRPFDSRHARGFMPHGSDILNLESSDRVSNPHNDAAVWIIKTQGVEAAPEKNWFLQEWMAHFDKRQASLTNELGWNKGRANHIWHGKQPYNRAIVNEVSHWLGVEPYELLMPPAKAMQLRRFEEAAKAIAAGT